MTEENARRIWDILVEHGGAVAGDGDRFVQYLMEAKHPEWRFQGHFGFGGKLYVGHRGPYVGFYQDDHTPEREALATKINALLAAI